MSGLQNPSSSAGTPPQIPGVPQEEITAALGIGGGSDIAWAEFRSLTSNKTPEQLEKEAAEAEHNRTQYFRQHFERIAIAALWVTAGAITLVGAIWLSHLLLPECMRWLSKDEVSHLQSIMTAGLLVGVIGNHFKKRMG